MKGVSAREPFGRLGIQTADWLKTDGTCLGMVYTALAVDQGWSFALPTVERYRRTRHVSLMSTATKYQESERAPRLAYAHAY